MNKEFNFFEKIDNEITLPDRTNHVAGALNYKCDLFWDWQLGIFMTVSCHTELETRYWKPGMLPTDLDYSGANTIRGQLKLNYCEEIKLKHIFEMKYVEELFLTTNK